MFLTKLELTGFKSFAKKTVLTFEPGITAIVGPNGSGKSNIADAVRWVLGTQSKKAVRGKVATDVIFSGTAAASARGLAEVSLTFDNADGKLPYEYREVVITRRLYRSGDSEYLVGGNPVRLTDLQHALAVAGIGAENYTVISQGMVDQALSQSPQERRSLFEEAAGVKQFYLRRDEALRKLKETAQNLSRVEDILGELGPRLKTLKRQASALAQAEATQTLLQEAYLAQYGHQYRDLQAVGRQLRKDRDDANREFMAVSGELTQVEEELKEQRERQQGLKLNTLLAKRDELRDARDSWQAELNETITAREVAMARHASLLDTKKQLASRLSALETDESVKVPNRDKDVVSRLSELVERLRSLDEEYAKLNVRLRGTPPLKDTLPNEGIGQKLETQLNKLEKAIGDEAPYASLRKHVVTLRRTVRQLSGAATPGADAGVAERISEVLKERDDLQKTMHELRLKDASYQQARQAYETDEARRKQEVAALKHQLASITKQLAALDKDIVAHTVTITDAGEKLAADKKKYATLEKDIEQEQQQGLGETGAAERLESLAAEKRRTQDEYRGELNRLNVELAKAETRLDSLTVEASGKLPKFPPGEQDALPPLNEDHERLTARLEQKLLELGGIDPSISDEHKEVSERFEFLDAQAADLRDAKSDLERVIRQLERKSQDLFKDSFQSINREFGKFFATLFGGGQAELGLTESEAEEDGPVQFGVEITATPPGKRPQNLAVLSGGERALTSVALLFAILKVNPSPFVLLDEVDAALDEANTGRFSQLLIKLAEQTQFVVVTHNRDTMKAAKVLYGVTMDETGVSTLLSIELPEAQAIPDQTKAKASA